jgi:hypothetical protein
MPLKAQITEDMKAAMRAKDAPRLSAIRLLLAAIKQREVDERIELSDADVLAIIEKMLKQRRDSVAQYEAGGRQDLADIEKFEIGVLTGYMPQQLSEAEIAAEAAAAVMASAPRRCRTWARSWRCSSPSLPAAPTWPKFPPWSRRSSAASALGCGPAAAALFGLRSGQNGL